MIIVLVMTSVPDGSVLRKQFIHKQSGRYDSGARTIHLNLVSFEV